MNNSVSEYIEQIIKQIDPAIRDDVARRLRACNFTSADDPALNGLAIQATLAGQPVRLVQAGGARVATDADLARLGDRIENTAWTLGRLKIGTVGIACLLSCMIGAGGVALAFKLWAIPLAGYFDLPCAPDARLDALYEIGATLCVKEREGKTYVYFGGDLQPASGQFKDGTNFLYFQMP